MMRHPQDRYVFLDETGANTKMARLYGWGPKSERVVSSVPHVQQQLVPTLTPGDIVVMDNLSSHHRAGIREAIESAGCTLAYLPPYGPDLNPIEQLFSKLKSQLRKHAERTLDSLDSLWTRIGQLVSEFLPDECRNYLRHAGYTANEPRKCFKSALPKSPAATSSLNVATRSRQWRW